MISSTWFKGLGKGNHASSFIAGGLGRRSMTAVIALMMYIGKMSMRSITFKQARRK
jgi:hypothetical protein